MSATSKPTNAKSFVRSLNLLLKASRLYGIDHARCAEQLRAAWSDLQALLGDKDEGCVLGLAGKQLLVDATPVETGPAERSLVDIFAATKLASIHFTAHTTEQDLRRLLRGFASIGPKAESAGDLLKEALTGGDNSIHLNSVRYVTQDAALGDVAAGGAVRGGSALPAATPPDFRQALEDPNLLLQILLGAQGTERAAPATTQAPRSAAPTEKETLQLLQTVAAMARAGKSGDATSAPLPQQLAELPAASQELFQQALASLAALPARERPEGPMLLQLAEHLAIRFALERFDRGEVRINSVRETLEKASREIATLRKILTGHEEALAKAGIAAESHADLLDRQFWAAVPESGKRTALLSPEAWCIPPRNVRQYVEELLKKKDTQSATAILLNYASCVGNEAADARRKAAIGLAELAGAFSRVEPRVLDTAIRCVGEQLTWEEDPETQELLGSAYARLAQEASGSGNLGSISTALSWLEDAAREKPALDKLLRPRLGVESRLPDFIEQAIREPQVSSGLAGLFRRSAPDVAPMLAARFGKCARREECRRVIELFSITGEAGIAKLRETLANGDPADAASTIGLLTSAGTPQLDRLLITRLSAWSRAQHDTVVQQLARASGSERVRLLARLFPVFNQMVLAQVVDEVSLSGDPAASQLLLRLAAGELPQSADLFLRVKAIEGLGRLREKAAIPALREIAGAKQMFRWAHPEEMRIVAMQSLSRMDPQWARSFEPQSGLKPGDLALAPLDRSEETQWARQRRYARVSLPSALSLVAHTGQGDVPVESRVLSLGGGITSAAPALRPGTPGTIEIKSGWRNVTADVLFREAPQNSAAFEIVEIGIEERSRLRKLLSQVSTAA